MSLRIVKAGLLDTLQDLGRYGYQHVGINPGGAMDIMAMQVANILVGNKAGEGVLEMHFPAAVMLFERPAMIALSGGIFNVTVNNVQVKINQPVLVGKGSELRFSRRLTGARVYLAVRGGFNVQPWLGSVSTNLKAASGGYKGRTLKNHDHIEFKSADDYSELLQKKDCVALPWQADTKTFYHTGPLRFVRAPEYELLDHSSQSRLETLSFRVSTQSDRMGFRLSGEPIQLKQKLELVSSGVARGTIQLLPAGDVIILMADHQTTGGYPRLGHIIGVDLSCLAQMNPGDQVKFMEVDIVEAQQLNYAQYLSLLQLQNACTFRLEKLL